MKYVKYILMSVLCVAALSSCAKWLDINTDPENPSSESASFQTRLPHIEFYTNHAQQIAAMRSTMICGDWTNASGNYSLASRWNMQIGIVTTAYQWWFVGAACNVDDMYKKAMAAEAWHYAGVARIIWAYGSMLMTDIYGEMPYTEACGEDATPSYDNGKTIYLGALACLDEGLELLAKSQDPALPTLAQGDYWCNGDVQKWIKFGNLLKARWIVKLNKKQPGSYTEGKYDADAILAALEKGPKNVSDNAQIKHTDDNGPTQDVLGWGEPVDYSPMYSVLGMNSSYFITDMLYQNLTNFDGKGIEDPRARQVIPWACSARSESTPEGVVFSGNWRRSIGVDMISDNSPFLTGGPLRAGYNAEKHFWIDTESEIRKGDTLYVESTSSSKGYAASSDLFYRRNGTKSGAESRESGSFYSRVSAPTYLGTYTEACFIKAEVLFNKGDKAGAYTAYKEGIKASIDQMNNQVNDWVAGDKNLAECPSFTVATDAEINAFLNNAIGTQADLTLGKIMTQKRLALMISVEIWNDMRRYDYDPDIFMNWGVPAHYKISTDAQKTIPLGKQPRRFRQCSHEFNYNAENLAAIGAEVPGANTSLKNWNTADDAWSINVWWDSDQQ